MTVKLLGNCFRSHEETEEPATNAEINSIIMRGDFIEFDFMVCNIPMNKEYIDYIIDRMIQHTKITKVSSSLLLGILLDNSGSDSSVTNSSCYQRSCSYNHTLNRDCNECHSECHFQDENTFNVNVGTILVVTNEMLVSWFNLFTEAEDESSLILILNSDALNIHEIKFQLQHIKMYHVIKFFIDHNLEIPTEYCDQIIIQGHGHKLIEQVTPTLKGHTFSGTIVSQIKDYKIVETVSYMTKFENVNQVVTLLYASGLIGIYYILMNGQFTFTFTQDIDRFLSKRIRMYINKFYLYEVVFTTTLVDAISYLIDRFDIKSKKNRLFFNNLTLMHSPKSKRKILDSEKGSVSYPINSIARNQLQKKESTLSEDTYINDNVPIRSGGISSLRTSKSEAIYERSSSYTLLNQYLNQCSFTELIEAEELILIAIKIRMHIESQQHWYSDLLNSTLKCMLHKPSIFNTTPTLFKKLKRIMKYNLDYAESKIKQYFVENINDDDDAFIDCIMRMKQSLDRDISIANSSLEVYKNVNKSLYARYEKL
ncbi:hypothetical protein D3C87_946030 [compost metagenome]